MSHPNEFANVNDSLVLVNIIFRHGNRTPDSGLKFKSNPHADKKYFPYGLDELIPEGQKTAYKLGKLLRTKYGTFLGNYNRYLMEAYSSNYRRTQMSLQSVLAALFPPDSDSKIASDLNWQPIPYTILPDNVLAVHRAYRETLSPITKIKDEETKQLYQYLSEKTGQKIDNSFTVFNIYNTLQVQQEMGFKMPEWAESIWNDSFAKAAYQYGFDSIEQFLPQLVGNLLDKIFEDSLAKISGTIPHKLFLYSGHDINFCALLGTFQAFKGQIINYGAYVALELHKIDQIYGFKIFQYNWEGSEPVAVEIPGCGYFCPVDKFKKKFVDKLCGINKV